MGLRGDAAPDRAPGFYWVQLPDGQWIVARYDHSALGETWTICGREEVWNESQFIAAIGPRVESPEDGPDIRAACRMIVEAIGAQYDGLYRYEPITRNVMADLCDEIAKKIEALGPTTDLRHLRAALHRAQEDIARSTCPRAR